MRLEEPIIAILVIIAFSFLWRLVNTPTYIRIIVITGIMVLFAFQLIKEMPWSMVPIWSVAGFILVVLGISLFQTVGLSKLWIIPGILFILVSVISIYIAPVFIVPEPKGPYAVGVKKFEWVDESRKELFDQEGVENRRLIVYVYYPATDVNGLEAKRFLENAAKASPLMRYGLPIPPFVFSQMGIARTNSFYGAEMFTDGKFPVILISHGYGTLDNYNTLLIEELASQGYIVAAINHTYSSLATSFSDGTIIPVAENVPGYSAEADAEAEVGELPPSMSAVLDQWVEDFQFVLDKLAELNTEEANTIFSGKLDLENIGIAGHSLGGNASGNFCVKDEQCSAFAVLDGTWSNREYIKTPVLIFEAKKEPIEEILAMVTEADLEKVGKTKEELNEDFTKAYEADDTFIQSWPYDETPLYFVKMETSTHYDFTDTKMISPLLKFIYGNGPVPLEKLTTILNTYVVHFFDEYLKGMKPDGLELEQIQFHEAEMNRYPVILKD